LKKLFLFFSFLATIIYDSFAQAPAIQWQRCFGGTNVEQANSIIQASDGGYFIGGISRSSDGDVTFHYGADVYADYWVVKTDGSGNLQWQKTYGGSSPDVLDYAIQADDGGYVLTGWTYSNDGDVTGTQALGDVWLVKTDTSGNIEWQNTMGGSGPDQGYRVLQTADGGFLASGSTSSNNGDVSGNHGYGDFWLVKVNSAGVIQWQKCFGGSTTEEIASVQLTGDGGYILAGPSYSNDQDVSGHHGATNRSDCWVVKLDSARNIQWQNSFGGSYDEEAFAVKVTTDGGYVIAGMSNSIDGDITSHHGAANTSDVWVFKLDAVGILQWEKSYGGTDDDEGFAISLCNDGGYIIAGVTSSVDGDITSNNGSVDEWIIKIDSTGNFEWQKTIGGSLADEATGIEQTMDGGFIVTGFSESNDFDVSGNHGTRDYWVVKLSAPNEVLSTEGYNFSGLFSPNPFKTYTTLHLNNTFKYSTLKIYNVLGSLVKWQIITEEATVINRSGMSNGIYFVRVTNSEREWVSKLVVE
jgi:hypothetical protein